MGNSVSSKVVSCNDKGAWEQILKDNIESSTNQLLVIDFCATWCGPCKWMEPVIELYSANYPNVKFIKIDVDKVPEVAREYEVDLLPAFCLLKKGKLLHKVLGARKDELKQKIEESK